VKMKLPLKVVFLTHGDNNQWSFLVYRKHPVIIPRAVRRMGEIRHNEALDAARVLGLSTEQVIFLGYPDFKTLAIWYAHWGDQLPAMGMLSKVKAVPYLDAFRPGALYKGEEIVKDLKNILQDFRPTKIFLSHPADYNPDHRALYLFTRVVLWELEEKIKPALYPYLIHFKQWPQPKGYRPAERMMPPSLFEREIAWGAVNLTPDETVKNKEAIKKHRSQYKSNPRLLLSFIRSSELFGDFPVINLREKNSGWFLSQHGQKYLNQLPEDLVDEERVDFVGIEKEFLVLEDKTLVFTLKLSRPVGKKVTVSLYVFGYRKDCAFQNMPKLHIIFKKSTHKVFDQGRLLGAEIVKVDRTLNEITLRIPLEALKNPEKILTSARTYRGSVPLDWVEWRILQIYDADK